METRSMGSAIRRERRSHAGRLTVDLPEGTLTALKIHAAQQKTTIREVVTTLISNKIAEGKNS